MADTAAEHRCFLEWNIFSPFLSRNLEAVFYHGSPTATQWKVIFEPIERRHNNLNFSVTLQTLESFVRSFGFVADRILVDISLNGECISRKEATNYHFNAANWHRYCIQVNGTMYPGMETQHLVIKIQISLPGRATDNLGNALFSCEVSLRKLKYDLKYLQDTKLYSNMNLVSSNDPTRIGAHSYIIEVRWDNFFRKHDFEVGDTVSVNIPCDLLKYILDYVYTGEVCGNRPGWENPAYSAELFQVINFYELYHLYKVFVKSDLQQVQVTRNPILVQCLLFPLDSLNRQPINNTSRTFYIEQKPEYIVVFRVQVRREEGHALSYSLQSKSRDVVHVRVNMELVKGTGGSDFQKVYSFHEEVHAVDPTKTVQSIRFSLGQFTWYDSLLSADGAETEYFIRCVLKVTNATIVHQVRSVDDDTLQTDEVRLGLLSDHMYKLRRRKFDADMVVSSSEGVRSYEYEDRIHKGILASRVSAWWAGLENGQEGDRIPDNARFTLDSLTLPFVLDYMYTGRVFSLPFWNIDDVIRFALQTTFGSLCDFVCSSIPLGVSREYFDNY